MSKACIFLADGFEEIEGLTVVDILRRAGVEIHMVSITGETKVTGSHGIEIKCDTCIGQENFSETELFVLPGGMPGTKNLRACKALTELLTASFETGKKLAAICAAPSVLGDLGILKGKKACCYPGFEEHLTGAQVVFDQVAQDGNVTTSRGMGTAIPFALSLVSQLVSEEKAQELAQSIIFKVED